MPTFQTYTVNEQVADSASTATAFLAGYKCQSRTMGVNQNVNRGNCSAVKGNEVKSILKHSVEKGIVCDKFNSVQKCRLLIYM